MAKLSSWLIAIRVNAKGVGKGLRTASKEFGKFGKGVSAGLGPLLSRGGGMLAAPLGVLLAEVAIVSRGAKAILGIAAAIDEIRKSAGKLGVGVEEFQRLKNLSELTGISTEKLRDAMRRTGVTGVKEFAELTRQSLKLNKEIFKGSKFEGLSLLTDETAKSLKEMIDVGIVSEKDTKNLSELNREFEKTSAVVRSIGIEIAAGVAPEFSKLLIEVREFAKTIDVSLVIEQINVGLRNAADIVKAMTLSFRVIASIWESLGPVGQTLVRAGVRAAIDPSSIVGGDQGSRPFGQAAGGTLLPSSASDDRAEQERHQELVDLLRQLVGVNSPPGTPAPAM